MAELDKSLRKRRLLSYTGLMHKRTNWFLVTELILLLIIILLFIWASNAGGVDGLAIIFGAIIPMIGMVIVGFIGLLYTFLNNGKKPKQPDNLQEYPQNQTSAYKETDLSRRAKTILTIAVLGIPVSVYLGSINGGTVDKILAITEVGLFILGVTLIILDMYRGFEAKRKSKS